MSLDERITVSSMATEMGAIIILFPPSEDVITYCRQQSGRNFKPVFADSDAVYDKTIGIDVSEFVQMVSLPGEPHNAVGVKTVSGTKIDSGFIGSCTNGRMEDMRRASEILRDSKVAPGVILKIVPATDEIWKRCLEEGLIKIFKNAGALVSNAGCAGCAAGQVGQNGQGEITISTGNRNFPGKQGKGSVYLASPEIVAASAIAGHITIPDEIPSEPSSFKAPERPWLAPKSILAKEDLVARPSVIEGKIWLIQKDNIDTDMIFHNKYLAVTDMKEMGQYTFDNLKGFEDFSRRAKKGDIIVAGKNFGSGSSRQQAVDCFLSLGISCIIAESFGAIYERNAINAALPVITCNSINNLEPVHGDMFKANLKTGEITNLRNNQTVKAVPFSEVQYEIYQKGGLLG